MLADILGKKFSAMAETFQHSDGKPHSITDVFIKLFFDTAAVIYRGKLCPMQEVKDVFVEFFQQTGFAPLHDRRFREKLKNVPQLSYRLLEAIVQPEGIVPSLFVADKPQKCHHCSRWMDSTVICRMTWLLAATRGDTYQLRGLCDSCMDLHEKKPESVRPFRHL